jgi:hypothetical protein
MEIEPCDVGNHLVVVRLTSPVGGMARFRLSCSPEAISERPTTCNTSTHRRMVALLSTPERGIESRNVEAFRRASKIVDIVVVGAS